MEDIRQIIALGGGGFSMEPDNPLLDEYVLKASPVARPEICLLPTASAENPDYIERFYKVYKRKKCIPTHLNLTSLDVEHIRSLLLSQDIIYVGGGNTAHMLGVWRKLGVDLILQEAWNNGVVLAGVSAGSICWFEQGITDSFGEDLAVLKCLGFLPGSNCVHYDGESKRRPRYQEFVARQEIKEGWAADDGVALHFKGTELVKIVSSRVEARAYRVVHRQGEAVEIPVDPKFLG